jgi:hypothetical protein
MISTRESARPEGFRSTIETMNESADAEDAVARKRMRDAMKMTSGDEYFSKRRTQYSPPFTESLVSVVRALSMRRSALAMQRRASNEASKLLPLKFFDTARRMDRLLADATTDDPDVWRPSALIAERVRWASV